MVARDWFKPAHVMPRTRACRWLSACLLFVFFNLGRAAEPWVVEGRVVAIADGDTITILDRDKHQHKIRFNGIDAPEKKQPFGQRSRQNLSRLIFDRNVRAECHKRDRYGQARAALRERLPAGGPDRAPTAPRTVGSGAASRPAPSG
jgi:endonuclease YncB( thermonuclease family)